jgi:Zn-dependent protease
MIFTIKEIIDIIIMTGAIGFIFKDMFKVHIDDPLEAYRNQGQKSFWFSAIAFGLQATFHAAYSFLGLGVVLKLIGFPFIFFIPAYVSHPPTTALFTAIIAIMGPIVNALLAGGCWLALRYHLLDKKYSSLLQISVTVNLFLFGLNMLPIPGIDGFHFYKSIGQLLF